MSIELNILPPRDAFPYGLSMTGCDMGWSLYQQVKDLFGQTAEPREFWLEEGEPSGVWYHTAGQFWFLNQRDCLFFYLRYHNAEG